MLVNGNRSYLGMTDNWISRFIEHNQSARWFPLLMFEGNKKILREWQAGRSLEERFRLGLHLARREKVSPVYISHELKGLDILHEIQKREQNKEYKLDIRFWRRFKTKKHFLP